MEAVGPRPTKVCSKCKTKQDIDKFPKNSGTKDGKDIYCRACRRINNYKHAGTQMYVNGKYITKSHPLHKPGCYKSFDDAAFSALKGYNKTPKGHVYLIVNKAWNGWVKVGKAIDASDRLNSYQTSSPYRDYQLIHYIEADDRAKAERQAHNLIQKNATERLGEWFRIPLEFAIQLLNSLAGDLQHGASSPSEGT